MLDKMSIHEVSLKLSFLEDPEKTKMFEGLGDLAHFFEDHAITYNSHDWGIKPSKFETD